MPGWRGSAHNVSDLSLKLFEAVQVFDAELTEPENGAFANVQPASGGQQRRQFAGPVGQIEATGHATQVEFALLAGRPAVQVEPGRGGTLNVLHISDE